MASDSVKRIKLQSEHLLTHLSESNLKFTEDLYRILGSEDGDLFFSPISVQIPLFLLFSGASGKVAEEMKTGLTLSRSKEEVLIGLGKLLDDLKSPSLKIASQIFVEKTYVIKKAFTNLIKPYLESAMEPVDFKKSPAEAASVINSWVSEKTEKKISEVVPTDGLDEWTRLIVVNVIHFREAWCGRPFPKFATRDEPFHTTKNSVVNVPMMNDHKYLYYSEEKLYEALRIPFQNRDFNFVILLPKEIEGLREVENELSASEFRKLFDNLEDRRVNLTLPKFKMEKDIDMGVVLQKLGMETMFDKYTEDFSEIYASGQENLYVNNIFQKSMLDVNEDGCEAISVTRYAMCGGGPPPDNIVDFKVDHPFIFLILHRDVILFMGRKTFS